MDDPFRLRLPLDSAAELERRRRLLEAAEAQKREAERRARILWSQYYSLYDGCHVSEMSGAEFERYIATVYSRLGFDATLTPAGADQGVDLILERAGKRVAVQTKQWRAPVGNRAVQEVIAGKHFYACSHGLVISTSTFTRSAVALAASDPTIELIDKNKLTTICLQIRSERVPEFSWPEWEKIRRTAERFQVYKPPARLWTAL